MPATALHRALPVLVFVAIVMSRPAGAEVVFGNLGSSGTGSLSSTGTTTSINDIFAQGFSTGNSMSRTLHSVALGLFWDNSFAATTNLELRHNSGNAPGSVLATSSSVNVQGKAIYTFPFSSVALDANTTYWIVSPTGFTWYLNSAETTPSAQNGSGYSWVGTTKSVNGGSSWSNDATTSYSLSVNAVPEHGTSGLLLAGLAGCGFVVARRRLGQR